MKKYFTTGEFAKILNVSKQTLIYYDKIGLFEPMDIDEENNYRYYNVTQLEILDTIFILKEIGVPLKEIKQYLENRTTSKALDMLNERRKDLEIKIENEIKILNRLIAKQDLLNNALNVKNENEVFYSLEDERYIYKKPINPPYLLIDTEIAIKTLTKEITAKKYNYNYQIGLTISKEKLLAGDFLKANSVFTFVDEYIEDEYIDIKPKGLYATIYHKGAYREVDATYKALLDRIKEDNYDIIEKSFEECIIDSLATTQENNYLTKLSILVKKQ